jgi:hypothetical protein
VPRPKNVGSVSGSKSSAKKRPGFPPTPSRDVRSEPVKMRHELYKRVLADVQSNYLNNGLCEHIRIASGRKYGVNNMPELMALRPGTWMVWWWPPNDKRSRIAALKKAIALTAPPARTALGIRKDRPKGGVPAPRGTVAKRSLKKPDGVIAGTPKKKQPVKK